MDDFAISPLEDGSGLKLTGELDLVTTADLKEALSNVRTSHVVLDLSGLTFIDSCGIHAILELARRLNGDGPMVIRDPSPSVARVLEIVGAEQHPGVEILRTAAPPDEASTGAQGTQA